MSSSVPAILLSADDSRSSAHRADLDRGPDRTLLLATFEAIPLPRLDLRRLLRGPVRFARQELLSRASLSDAAGRRRGRNRLSVSIVPSAAWLKPAIVDRSARRRRTPRARHGPGAFAGPLHCLHEIFADQASGHGTQHRARRAAAVVRRSIRLGRKLWRRLRRHGTSSHQQIAPIAPFLRRTTAKPAQSIFSDAATDCLRR